jgi:4-coumarate--CoA ligase
MVFRSKQPDIDCEFLLLGDILLAFNCVPQLTLLAVPTDLTIWNWLFNSKHSPLNGKPASEIRGYTNANTKERISYLQVQEYTTYLSTALVKKYGLEEQQTVALFSPNTIWLDHLPIECCMWLIETPGTPLPCLGRFAQVCPATLASKESFQLTSTIGGKVSGASPAYNVEEMTYALQKADAKFLMTMPMSMEVASAAAKNAGIPQDRIFLLEGEMEGFTTMKQLLEIGKAYGESGQIKSHQLPAGKKNKDVCAFLSFSSGTTGLPKAVRLQLVPLPFWYSWHCR